MVTNPPTANRYATSSPCSSSHLCRCLSQAALPSRLPAPTWSAPVGLYPGFPCDTRVATGTPGSHLLHSHEPLGLSKLHPYRSQGHRGTDKAICLYGDKRALTNNSNRVGGRVTPAVLPHHADMPFGIRRFMKQTGSAAELRAAKPAPYGRTRTWGRRGSCAARRHSTTDRVHWWLSATLAPCLSRP